MAFESAGRTIETVKDPERRLETEEPEAREAHPERTCPNCGAPLIERKCKLLCPNLQCGYYMSCSDFY